MRNRTELKDRGNTLLGILGAFFGATVGGTICLLLILVLPEDLNKLGFVSCFGAGFVSCLGYRLFRGLRSVKFAWNTVRICSFLSAFPGMLFALALYALSCGVPVGRFLRRSLEMLGDRRGLVMLAGLGLFFLLGTRLGFSQLLRYTDPAWYKDPRRLACAERGGALYNDPAFWRLTVRGPVPEEFTVDCLTVSGETITVCPRLKKAHSFSADEIAGVILGPRDGHNILYNRNNEALARFAWSREGAGDLARYLIARQVPFFDLTGVQVNLDAETERPELPRQFIVRESRVCLVAGWIGAVLFGGVSLFCAVLVLVGTPGVIYGLIVFAVLTLLFGWMLSAYYHRRLEVDGEELRYTTSLGRTTCFHISEVKRSAVSLWLGTVRLYSREGRILARFEDNMENSNLLTAYLDQFMGRNLDRR